MLNQFFYDGKSVVPDDIMEKIRGEIHDETNILYPYEIPLMISILECILKRNELFISFTSKEVVDPSHISQQKSTILYSACSML